MGMLNESQLSIDNSPRFMKLPNAVKCIQFCDHQVSDGKPFRHSEQQQQPQEEQQKEQPQKEQQQSTPNRHGHETTTTAECSQPSSLEHDEYHKTVAPQGHLAVEAGLGGKESRDKHPEQIKASTREKGDTVSTQQRPPLSDDKFDGPEKIPERDSSLGETSLARSKSESKLKSFEQLEKEKFHWDQVLAKLGQEYDAQLERQRQLHRSELVALRLEIASRIS